MFMSPAQQLTAGETRTRLLDLSGSVTNKKLAFHNLRTTGFQSPGVATGSLVIILFNGESCI